MTSLPSSGGTAFSPPSSTVWAGILLALGTISIWVGWFISTRYLVIANLTAEEIAALRFGVSGLILAPFAWSGRRAIAKLAPWQFALMATGAGAPYVLVIAAGLAFAPASHAAALTPGVMPLFVAVMSVIFLKEKMSLPRKQGFALILLGVICIAGTGVLAGQPGEWKGHLLFLTGAFMWACYTLALRGSGLNAIEATAVVSVTSLVLFLPWYAYSSGARLLEVPQEEIILAAVYQGLLTGALSLVTYAKAVEMLGASRAAAFASLIPVLTLLAAIPLLGEMPGTADIVGIVLVSAGVFLATGTGLPRFSHP